MEHMEGDIPYPYLPPPTPTPTYPHPPLRLPTPPTPTPTYPHPPIPLPLPTPTHPYPPLPPPTPTNPYHHPPLLPLTTTHPTTNNGLERGQVIGNVQMWSRSRRWIQTPPTPTTPLPRNTQLDLSSRNSNGSKRITVQMNSHKRTLKPKFFFTSHQHQLQFVSNLHNTVSFHEMIKIRGNNPTLTLKPNIFLHISSTSTLISFKSSQHSFISRDDQDKG